jgi:hypothetical protein
MPNQYICLKCNNAFTKDCDCIISKCTRCGSTNVLTSRASVKLNDLKTKLCYINCRHFKHIADVATVSVDVCDINSLDIKTLILCPINKW